MSYREETHSVECQAATMIAAIENLRDAHKTVNTGSANITFRIALQNNTALQWADVLLDPEQVGIVDVFTVCKCEVKFQAAYELGSWFLMGEDKLAEYRIKDQLGGVEVE